MILSGLSEACLRDLNRQAIYRSELISCHPKLGNTSSHLSHNRQCARWRTKNHVSHVSCALETASSDASGIPPHPHDRFDSRVDVKMQIDTLEMFLYGTRTD